MIRLSKHTLILCSLVLFVTVPPVFSQEPEAENTEAEVSEETEGTEPTQKDQVEDEQGPEFGFGLDLALGVETFNLPGTDEQITWQKLALLPDFSIGKFGIGIDLSLHFRFTGGPEKDQFEVRREDWVPDENTSFLELYLPKFRYVRYGEKGDPLYIKLGSIDDALLGNGFIMNNYANTLFLPEKRVFGLSFDFDGKLFSFPYLGIEYFIGNLAVFDVIGGRIYTRPLAGLETPVLKELEIGATVAGDRAPYHHSEMNNSEASVLIFGFDTRVPILSGDIFSLATFGDIVFQPGTTGGMVGIGGRLLSVITYGAQMRFLGENFLPTYFDATYDLFRVEKYLITTGSAQSLPAYTGWFGTLGLSFLEDQLVFKVSMDGPIGYPATQTINGIAPENNYVNYPHLRILFLLNQGVIPGFFFDITYDKKLIRNFADLVSPEQSVITAKLNYKAGAAVISFLYSLRYNPDAPGENSWETTSGLQTSISLF